MSETVSVRIPREQYDRLVALAKQKGVMISWLHKRCVDIGLEAETEWMQQMERFAARQKGKS